MHFSYLIFACFVSMLCLSCDAQIKNASVSNVRVYGNCGMCKKRIEKAGNQSGIAQVKWDTDAEMAQITYDGSKTTPEDVLKRIAAAGHDSDQFRADKKVYDALHACCQYARPD
jgi:copper chaperone CopZ